MSKRIKGIPIICVEPDGKCELCGKIAECRPYGPHGEKICLECGQKNPKTTERIMKKVLFGEESA